MRRARARATDFRAVVRWRVLWLALPMMGLGACGDDGTVAPDAGPTDTGRPMVCADPPGSRGVDDRCDCEEDCSGAGICDFEDVHGYAGGACLYGCMPGTGDCGPDAECVDLGAALGVCTTTCSTSSDCGGAGRYCDGPSGRCFFLCQHNSDCLSDHCDPYSGSCTDGTPPVGKRSLEECVRDDECRSGVCERVQNRCISSCALADPLCPPGDVCVPAVGGGEVGVCQPRCMTDDECTALGLVCRTVSAPLGTFRVCSVG